MLEKHLGKALAYWRTERGLTQGTLATSLRVHLSTVSDIETGKRKVRFEEIARICNLLGVPLLDVIDQAYVDYRNEVVRSAQESGGWLMENSTPSLSEMDARTSSLMDTFGSYLKDFCRYMRQPSQVEVLRANLAAAHGEAGNKSPAKRRGRPPKAAGRKAKK
jgi:transcriptional regulator with XRE-family HTH domain